MPAYTVTLKSSAEKDMNVLTESADKRIGSAILGLSATPRPQGVKKLKGEADFWRVRVGDYRILYTIDDKARHIRIMRVGHRREVYD